MTMFCLDRKMCSKQIQLIPFLLFVTAVVSASQVHSIAKRSTKCVLPPYPKYGLYAVAGDPAAKPGDEADYVYLNVSCDPHYGVDGNNVVLCILGEWSTTVPECVRFCRLLEHPGVTYSCNSAGTKGYGPCGEYEPPGTFVKPQCSRGYYTSQAMRQMLCIDGSWDYDEALCSPECGLLSDKATTLPWYVNINRREKDRERVHMVSTRKICAGSIISPNIVMSELVPESQVPEYEAGHCFWNTIDRKIRTSGYFVISSNGFDENSYNQELFPVKDVKVPERFRGSETNFQDDIALVILSQAFTYSTKVQPVCLDFDYSFNKMQLQEGNVGTVGVFSLSSDEGTMEPNISLLRIPYIPIQTCLEIVPPYFSDFITADKICAGRKNATIICVGNSGAGLAFPGDHRGDRRYYLRGVVSTAPSRERPCDPSDFVTFTHIYSHKDFIREHLVESLPPRMMGWQADGEAL